MIDIELWMQDYIKVINEHFGHRVIFIGLQGSYARKEASKTSDIDVVLILDRVDITDLVDYRNLVDKLPHRELLCGFVSGQEELAAWSPHDLFQFYYDTVPLQGSLEGIIPPVTAESARQAALIGACNLYHACSHNFIHAQQPDALRMLYKSAFFVMQADYFCKTGVYLHSRSELKDRVNLKNHQMMQALIDPAVVDQSNLQEYSQLLLEWSADIISEYGAK